MPPTWRLAETMSDPQTAAPCLVAIAAPIALDADLSERAGLPLQLSDGHIEPGPDVLVEEDLVRRLSEMLDVVADEDGTDGSRLEYRMLNGVRRSEDAHLADLPLRYELTAMFGRPIGWEAAKTLGHVHVRPAGHVDRLPRGRRSPAR